VTVCTLSRFPALSTEKNLILSVWRRMSGARYTPLAEPSLISTYGGRPTQTYGQCYHDHLAALHGRRPAVVNRAAGK